MPLSLSFSEGSRYDRGTDSNELLQGCGGVEKSAKMVYLSMSGTGIRLESVERHYCTTCTYNFQSPDSSPRVTRLELGYGRKLACHESLIFLSIL